MNVTIMDARKMDKGRIEIELGRCAKVIEELGMDHVKACELISNVMNLGIAMQEKYGTKK